MSKAPVFTVKNWTKFQHYARRNPPWIKLHRSLLDDVEYRRLPHSARALLVDLWLLASETDNAIPADLAMLAWRLREPQPTIVEGLTSLVARGLIVDASGALAACKHDSIPETETETERETEAEESSVLRTEAGPRTDLAHLMGTLRETGYAPDGRPPAPDDPARDGSVFKALLRGGRSVDDLADALRGVRAVADRQLPLPEGDRAWLAPFEKFTARWLYHTKWGSRPLADVARDVWRKGRPSGPRGGTADVGTVVERLT